MLDENTFPDSYTRIFGKGIKMNLTGDRFFSRFYEKFVSSSREVAEAFKNTDMDQQKNMLKRSLLYSINFITNINNFHSMRHIALSHSKKGYNIKPELYDLWMDCMADTVREFDPEFDDDVELAWRLAFAPGITYMKYMYNK